MKNKILTFDKIDKLAKNLAKKLKSEILDEFSSLEKDLSIDISIISIEENIINNESSIKIIHALNTAHNGVFRMSPEVEGLVEASNNIARVELKNGVFQVLNLTRS